MRWSTRSSAAVVPSPWVARARRPGTAPVRGTEPIHHLPDAEFIDAAATSTVHTGCRVRERRAADLLLPTCKLISPPSTYRHRVPAGARRPARRLLRRGRHGRGRPRSNRGGGEHTCESRRSTIAGGHFFIPDDPTTFLRQLVDDVRVTALGAGPAPIKICQRGRTALASCDIAERGPGRRQRVGRRPRRTSVPCAARCTGEVLAACF